MKKLMLLIAVFMLGSASIAFAQEPVKKEQPATEQTNKEVKEEPKKEVKEEPKKEAKEGTQAEKPAAKEKANEAEAQSAK